MVTRDARHRSVYGSMPDLDCACRRCIEEEEDRRAQRVTNVLHLLVTTDIGHLEPDPLQGYADHDEAWAEIGRNIVKGINRAGEGFAFNYGSRPTVEAIEWEGEEPA